MKCVKEGCPDLATVTIILKAVDGEGAWRACYKHAMEFSDWCALETEAQDGTLVSAFLWTRE